MIFHISILNGVDSMTTLQNSVKRPFIRARIFQQILRQANISPIKQTEILKEEGLLFEDLNDYEADIPLNSYMRMFERLSIVTNSPAFGLKTSKAMGPELVGAVGFIFLSSPNLKSAIEYYSKSVSTIQEVTQLIFERDPHPILKYVITDEKITPRRQDVEFSIGYVNGLLKRFIGKNYRPKEIYFEHAKPIKGDLYETHFNCPVFFEQDINAIVLNPDDLQRGSAKFDQNLIPLLEHYLQLLEHNTQRTTSFVESIEQILSHAIEHDIANLSYVSGRLGLSENTVRRRLKKEGTSFRELFQKKRVAIAIRLLSETHTNILQIAQKVGYSETASFTRAFRKETGQTPTKFRKTQTLK